MNYDDMTTTEIKQTLMSIMRERETVHFMLGWLQQVYVTYDNEAVERRIAITQLKKYGF